LLQDTEHINSADCVVIESTYGDRLHPKENPVDAMQSEINKVEVSGGTLLIPAFSLDRTQEILHMIMHLKKRWKG
jgi:metallo-beta-lactamase family protein